MKPEKPKLLVFLLCALLPLTACESPAATGEVEVVIQRVNSLDLDDDENVLAASASLPEDACSLGPCDPNPCPDAPESQKTWCGATSSGMAECMCPPGETESPDEPGTCVESLTCVRPMTGQAGACNGSEDACERTMGELVCNACQEGYLGEHCAECDTESGFFPDGFGRCAKDVSLCRDGQGGDAFQALLTETSDSLGHNVSELELVSANMAIVEGTTQGVRSWTFLWEEGTELPLILRPLDGPDLVAGKAIIPPETAGLQTVKFDIIVDRPTLTRHPEFQAGDFSVGIRGQSPRTSEDEFAADVKLSLEFATF